MSRWKIYRPTLAATVMLSLAAVARGNVITTDLITINVTGVDGSGSWHLPVAGNYTPGSNFSWTNTSPISVKNTATQEVLATVPTNGLSLTLVDDPQIT